MTSSMRDTTLATPAATEPRKAGGGVARPVEKAMRVLADAARMAASPTARTTPARADPAPSPEPSMPTMTDRDALDVVLERLRTGAAALLRSSGEAGRERLVSITAGALSGLIETSLRDLRLRIGGSGSSLDPTRRRRFQDLVLAMRPDRDAMLADAARALSPSELLALLSASCDRSDPASLDAIRCRELVLGGTRPLAREAALDMAKEGLGAAARARIEAVVARQVRASLRAGLDETMLPLLDALLPTGAGAEPSEDVGAAGRPMIAERLLGASLASGNTARAASLLAEAASVGRGAVETAMDLRDGRALTTLVWRAGYDPRLAASAQIVLGRVAPDDILDGSGDDGFPLLRAEMAWTFRALGASS